MTTTTEYQVEYEERDGFLHACVSGDADTAQISLAYWNEIAQACRARGYKRMLVVEHFRQNAPMGEMFVVASKIPEIIRGLTVAFVDEVLAQYESNRFGEDVAVNRGADGRVFKDEASALAWLQSLE
jgi:alkanesulfonate monooxygenase SsuD/methylene tetrahydromethanopterin reductase-like flavin-dependent oxidoreductase (luciferase family)